jgi:hypothetical protein
MIRRSYLRPGAPPKRRSWLPRSTKRIPQVNVDQTRRRRARNAKRMRSPEYKAAKAGAMERSGRRCEFTIEAISLPYFGVFAIPRRCEETKRLHFHEEVYPKTRPLTADDGKIYCYSHHMLTESKKPHKHGRPYTR